MTSSSRVTEAEVALGLDRLGCDGLQCVGLGLGCDGLECGGLLGLEVGGLGLPCLECGRFGFVCLDGLDDGGLGPLVHGRDVEENKN